MKEPTATDVLRMREEFKTQSNQELRREFEKMLEPIVQEMIDALSRLGYIDQEEQGD